MNADFHYYAVAVLARAAGFTAEDALTIAYASQYVDDATESAPLRVGEFLFEPVRSAHQGLRTYSWAVQKKVHIPFHFLPAYPFDPGRVPDPHFETQADSPFANEVLNKALRGPLGLYGLCSIGIALHVYADTWAHQKFSGKKDNVNDVRDIRLYLDGRWKKPFWQNLYLDLLPRVGHPQASDYPDIAWLNWRYRHGRPRSSKLVSRDNPRLFLQSAERIYGHLSNASKTEISSEVIPWETIEKPFRRILGSPLAAANACAEWKSEFGGLFGGREYHYDRLRWRAEALGDVRGIRWDKKRPASFKRMWFKLKADFFDSAWVQFHRAAQKHRHFVLERLV